MREDDREQGETADGGREGGERECAREKGRGTGKHTPFEDSFIINRVLL